MAFPNLPTVVRTRLRQKLLGYLRFLLGSLVPVTTSSTPVYCISPLVLSRSSIPCPVSFQTATATFTGNLDLVSSPRRPNLLHAIVESITVQRASIRASLLTAEGNRTTDVTKSTHLLVLTHYKNLIVPEPPKNSEAWKITKKVPHGIFTERTALSKTIR